MKILGALLGIIAILGTFVGLASLSEATLGIGLISASVVASIFSRLFQADAHNLEQKKNIQELQKEMYEIKRILAHVHKIKVD